MQFDLIPHNIYHTPYNVAMQWYISPAMKTIRVFNVRQTSPQGITLLKRKSIIPVMYSNESNNVPTQTMVEPYNIKFRKG